MDEEALKAGGVAGAAFVFADCKDLMKRKLVKKVTYTDHWLEPGPSFTTEPVPMSLSTIGTIFDRLFFENLGPPHTLASFDCFRAARPPSPP
jgi:hypothetical protein